MGTKRGNNPEYSARSVEATDETIICFHLNRSSLQPTGHSSEAQTSILNVYAQNKFDAEIVAMQQQRYLTLRVNFFGQANAEKKNNS